MSLVLLSITAIPAVGANIVWSGNTSSNWTDATNWVGGIAPGGADIAFIDNGNFAEIDGVNAATVSDLRVGHAAGSGILTFLDGGMLEVSNQVHIGAAGSTGEVLVAGVGSILESNDLQIGRAGNGMMIVENSGWSTANSLLYVGTLTGSSGTLNIRSGGTVESISHTYIGHSTSTTGEAIVSGAGSLLESGGILYVGNNGRGTLTVENGAGATSIGNTNIGFASGSVGELTVTGTGSNFITTGQFNVASSGTGTVSITDGGSATASYTRVGIGAGTTGTLTVDGPGSRYTVSGNQLRVGELGNGTINVSNGAEVSSSFSTSIGNGVGSTGTGTVSGAGSSLLAQTSLFVGNSGSGTLTLVAGGSAGGTNGVQIANANGSTGTLNIGAAEGDAAVSAGIVDADSVTFGSGTGEIVFNHTNADYTFAPTILGNGALKFLSGSTYLSGDSSDFTGTVSVTGGTLSVSGKLAGTTTIGTGGTFKGNGSAGDLVFNNGSTIAPGNSIGTTSVVSATFNPGSNYEVEINAAGQSDLLDASGTVTINGGTVEVIPFPDYALGTTYTIITAIGGIAGMSFDTLVTPGLINGQLTYGANDVFLTLSPNSAAMQALAQTPNQKAVAGATGNASNDAINALYALTDAAYSRRALDVLSGEVHASLSAAQINEQRALRDIALKRRQEIRLDTGDGTLWASGFAQVSDSGSDGNAASTNARTGGVLFGAEKQYVHGYIGMAAGHSFTTLDVDGRSSSAQSRNYHLVAFGGSDLTGDGLTLDSGGSYTLHSIDTDRANGFEGFSGESEADYHAHTAQLFARVTQSLQHDATTIKPYAEGAVIHHRTDSFHERGAAGLEGDTTGHTTLAVTLGLDAAQEVVLDDDRPVTLEGGLAWQHMIGDKDVDQSLSFRDADTGFTVQGTPLARDALLLHAGASTAICSGTNASISYVGSLADGTRTHALSARIGIRF